MKTLAIALLLVCVPTAWAQTRQDEAFLEGIRQVEVGTHWNGIPQGGGGLTDYQFRATTWLEYDSSLSDVYNPFIVKTVALRYLHDIQKSLKERGIEPTYWRCAAAWNAGPRADEISHRTQDYADRVCNLMERDMAEAKSKTLAVNRPDAAVQLLIYLPERS